MNKTDLKPILKDFLHKMMGEWFNDRKYLISLGNALIDANINKYDNILDMFADENGEMDIDGLLNNLSETLEEPIKIDLQKFHPLLPNRILLITKQDINYLSSLLGK